MIEIMVVVLIISVIVAIAVPSFMQSSTASRRTTCVENLRIIESAKEQFGMSHNLKSGDEIYWPDIVPNYVKQTPNCPTGGVYALNGLGINATCSLSAIGHHQ